MEDSNREEQSIYWWQHLIFSTKTRVRIGVRDAPHIWGAGEIRDAGERRLFGGLARSEPFVTPHVWGTGEMSTEISATYLGRCGNKHWKSRRIYVALGHDELMKYMPSIFHVVLVDEKQLGDPTNSYTEINQTWRTCCEKNYICAKYHPSGSLLMQ